MNFLRSPPELRNSITAIKIYIFHRSGYWGSTLTGKWKMLEHSSRYPSLCWLNVETVRMKNSSSKVKVKLNACLRAIRIILQLICTVYIFMQGKGQTNVLRISVKRRKGLPNLCSRPVIYRSGNPQEYQPTCFNDFPSSHLSLHMQRYLWWDFVLQNLPSSGPTASFEQTTGAAFFFPHSHLESLKL